MKHFLLCLTALSFTVAFTACNKDDDNNSPTFSKDGKRLVSKITETSKEFPDEKMEVFFSYNSEGAITTIEYKSTYISEDDEKKYTDTDRYTYSISGKTLTVVNTYKDGEFPEDSGTFGGTFTLNEDGFVESGSETDSDEDDFIYSCYYDDNHYLTKMEYTRNGGSKSTIHYTRINGDITKGTYGYTYTYSEEENKGNIDFAEINSFMLGYDRSNLAIAGYLGKINKHLLKTENNEQDDYSYKFDQEGFVVKYSITTNNRDIYDYEVNYN